MMPLTMTRMRCGQRPRQLGDERWVRDGLVTGARRPRNRISGQSVGVIRHGDI